MHEKSFKRHRNTMLLLSAFGFCDLLTSFDPETEMMKVCHESRL